MAIPPAPPTRNCTAACDDGQPISNEGGRVVEKAFALEDAYEVSRNSQRAHDRKDRHRIWRSDDRAQRDRGGPRERWMQRMRDHSDGGRRNEYHDDR